MRQTLFTAALVLTVLALPRLAGALPAKGCCVAPGYSSCLDDKYRIDCDQIYAGNSGTNFYEGYQCTGVVFCMAPGKCQKKDGTDCKNTTRLDCGKLVGYDFSPNQTCGTALPPSAGTTCCAEPPSANNPHCDPSLDRTQCQQRGWIFSNTPCANISYCYQARAGEGEVTEPPPQLLAPLKFTPNVPIPGSEFSGGTVDVNSSLFARYVGAFYIYFIGVVGILAVVMMMWGGYHYVTALGNPAKMQQGKETINNALIGLVLALTSVILLRTVNPALVDVAGLFPDYISQRLQSFGKTSVPIKSFDCQRQMYQEMPVIIQKIKAGDYDLKIQTEANKSEYGGALDAYRLLAILSVESSGVPDKQSNIPQKDGSTKHACGLMQVVPDQVTGTPYNCEQLKNPDTGIQVGVSMYAAFQRNACYKSQNKHCADKPVCDPDDVQYTVASYNAGYVGNYCSPECRHKTVWQCEKSNSRYQETRCYVQAVDDAYDWLKSNFTIGTR